MSKYNKSYEEHLEKKYASYTGDQLMELYKKEPNISPITTKFVNWCNQISINNWVINKKKEATEEEIQYASLKIIEAKQALEKFDDFLIKNKVTLNAYNSYNKVAGPAQELTDKEKDIKALLGKISKKSNKKAKKQQIKEEEEKIDEEDKELNDYLDDEEETKIKEKQPKKDKKSKKEDSKPKKE